MYGQNSHTDRFQDQLSSLNPDAVQRLGAYKQALVGRGALPDQAAKIANGLLSKSIGVQAQLRFSIDYYQMISWLLLGIIILIALFPSINKTEINIKANQPAPVAY